MNRNDFKSMSTDELWALHEEIATRLAAALTAEAGRAGVALTMIGTIADGAGAPRFLDAQGNEMRLLRLSYSHF